MSTKRPPKDEDIRKILVEACGNKCCVCHRKLPLDLVPLHDGHIQRHTDGGSPSIVNTIPVCRSCNTKYKGTFTEDTRPHDWPNVFAKLLLSKLRVGILLPKVSGDLTQVSANLPDTEAIQNTRFLDLDSVSFVRQKSLYKYLPGTPQTLDELDAISLVKDTIREARKYGLKFPPAGPRFGRLVQLAMGYGADGRFTLAANEFFLQHPWSDKYPNEACWAPLSDTFTMYLEDAETRIADNNAAELRKQQEAEQGIQDERQKYSEVMGYCDAQLDNYLPKHDRDWILARRDQEVPAVITPDDIKRCDGIRNRMYLYTELLTLSCLDMSLDGMKTLMLHVIKSGVDSVPNFPSHCLDEYENIKQGIGDATTKDEVLALAKPVAELVQKAVSWNGDFVEGADDFLEEEKW